MVAGGNPTGEELKRIMMTNGGTYHHYYSRSSTTHVIASNLPDSKVRNLNTDRIVSPRWISESLEAGKLLDYTKYLLYTRQSHSQPKLNFKQCKEPEINKKLEGNCKKSSENLGKVRKYVRDFTGDSGLVEKSAEKIIVDDVKEAREQESVLEIPGSDASKTSEIQKNYKTQSNRINELERKQINNASDIATSRHTPEKQRTYKPQNNRNNEVERNQSAQSSKMSTPVKDATLKPPTAGHQMSTANPGFLSEFYHNSRLHHISTMGATFKEYVNQLQRKNEGFPGRANLTEWMKTQNKYEDDFESDIAGSEKSSGLGDQNKDDTVIYELGIPESGKPNNRKTRVFGDKNIKDSVNESTPTNAQKDKNQRTIMHIVWIMDCFFVSVGLRKHPELRGKPVAVTHARTGSQSQAREGMDRQYELNYYKQRTQKRLTSKMRGEKSYSAIIKYTKTDSFEEDDFKEETNAEEDAFDEDIDDHNYPTCNTTMETIIEKPGNNTPRNKLKPHPSKFSTLSLIDESSSMSEIASCNYEARKAGVKNGMFMGPALKLCPNLQTLPYDLEGYKEVSYKLYDIMASLSHDIEAVSCDEMFVDLTELLESCRVSPLTFTTFLRQLIQGQQRSGQLHRWRH